MGHMTAFIICNYHEVKGVYRTDFCCCDKSLYRTPVSQWGKLTFSHLWQTSKNIPNKASLSYPSTPIHITSSVHNTTIHPNRLIHIMHPLRLYLSLPSMFTFIYPAPKPFPLRSYASSDYASHSEQSFRSYDLYYSEVIPPFTLSHFSILFLRHSLAWF